MIRNFTPHPISIYLDGTVVREIPSEGSIRLDETAVEIGSADGFTVFEVQRTSTALPTQESGVWLVVSDMVRSAFPERTDLLSPYGIVRDDSGRILGNESFAGNPA